MKVKNLKVVLYLVGGLSDLDPLVDRLLLLLGG
jgi:hypothetical protein